MIDKTVQKKLIDRIFLKIKNLYNYNSKHRIGRRISDENLLKYINGILYTLKTGCQCNELPLIYGPKSTVHYNFIKWSKKGIFKETWEELLHYYNDYDKYNTNLTLQIIDTTLIKSINGHDLVGKNPTDRGRNATKISIITNKCGIPISYYIDKASVHDSKLFEKTIKKAILKSKKRVTLLADKGYSSMKNKKIAKKYNTNLICPNKSNFKKCIFKKDNKLKKRYIVEACNSWIKQFRRMRVRYENKIDNFESFLLLTFSIIIIRKMSKN